MDLEIILLNEVNQGKTNIIWHCFSVKSEKIQMNLFTKKKINWPTEMKNKLWLPKGKGGEVKLGGWDLHIHTIHKIDNEEGPTV